MSVQIFHTGGRGKDVCSNLSQWRKRQRCLFKYFTLEEEAEMSVQISHRWKKRQRCLFKSLTDGKRGRDVCSNLSQMKEEAEMLTEPVKHGSEVELTRHQLLIQKVDRDFKSTPFLANGYSGYFTEGRPWQPYSASLSHCKKHEHK